MESVFAHFHDKLYRTQFDVELLVSDIRGGIPKHPDVALAWIRNSLGDRSEDEIREIYLEKLTQMGLLTEPEEGMTIEEMTAKAKQAQQMTAEAKLMVGFIRTVDGQLAVEGRNLKAMIKEAANSLWPKRRWGPSGKGTIGYWGEHVHVVPVTPISLGIDEPTGVDQRFVHTRFGSSIRLEEYVRDALIAFHLKTDADNRLITPDDWGMMWAHAETLGFGASRSLSFGQFKVVKWEPA